jgi:hypothetical protein
MGALLNLQANGMLKRFLLMALTLSNFMPGDSLADAGERRGHDWAVTAGLLSPSAASDFVPGCDPINAYWIELRKDGKPLAKDFRCSTYWLDAQIVIDAKGNPFVLIRRNEGQGSNARSEYLDVAVWNGEFLLTVQTAPLGLPQGPAGVLEFTYTVSKLPEGGLELQFEMRMNSDNAAKSLPKPKPIPRQMTVRIVYK